VEETSIWASVRGWISTSVATLVFVVLFLPPAWVGLYRIAPVPVSAFELFYRGNMMRVDRDWVDFDNVSPRVIEAVISAEDTKFCSHSGFDWQAIQGALADYQRGESLRGASTLSMQTARTAFLWTGRSYIRKGLEAYFTLWIELLLPKRRILEIYLNTAEWGDGIYGIEAAAQQYFGKPSADLKAIEAARLATILPSPRRWKANPPSPYVARRANTILKRMALVRQGKTDCLVREPRVH